MPRGLNRYDEAGVVQRRLWTPSYWQTDVWYDAADLSTLTLVNGDVSEWRDKSGFGRHVSQATAANRPTYSSGGLNGRPTLDWGTAQNNKGLRNLSLTNYNPVRIFVVADYDGPNPFDQYYGLVCHNAFTSSTDVLLTNTTGTSYYVGGSFHNGNPTATGTALPTISAPFVLATNYGPANNPKSAVYIGNDRGFADRGWSGKISEVFVIDFLPSVAERNRAEGYLAWKYGIQLDARHPFVNRPPLIGD